MGSLIRVAPAAVRSVLRLAAGPGGSDAARLAPPARRSERALASAAHRGFQISVLISLALLLGLLALRTHTTWLPAVELAFGTEMIGEGLLLATDWRGARRLTLWRLRRSRAGAHGSPWSILERMLWKLASPALQLLGLIWLATGLLTALVGVQGLT